MVGVVVLGVFTCASVVGTGMVVGGNVVVGESVVVFGNVVVGAVVVARGRVVVVRRGSTLGAVVVVVLTGRWSPGPALPWSAGRP